MKIHDSIKIAAPPTAVWPLLADPEKMAAWHERLVSVQRTGTGPVSVGERFQATYSMSGRRGNAETEVIGCQPPVELVYRHHIKMGVQVGYVDERFDLIANGESMLLKQAVDFKMSGIPWWARGLMWVISNFGRATGPSLLEPLKKAAEARRL